MSRAAVDRAASEIRVAKEAPADPIHLTDRGNAQRLQRAHGEDLRWVAKWRRWIVWDGERWKLNDEFEVRRRAARVLADLYRWATAEMERLSDAAGEDEEALAALKVLQATQTHARKSEDAKRLNAMVDLLRSEPGVKVEHDRLDADPWLLNCNNGTLDLRTGGLLPHDRDDMLTKLCPTDYEDQAKCPLWERTLLAIFSGKQALVDYFRRLCGYCLTGDVREDILPIFWGSGSNGKSLIFETIRYVIGNDYAGVGANELLMSSHHEPHPTYLVNLFGKRLVTLAETREGGRLNESLIKKLTGRDTVNARGMRQDFWSFPPTHKIWLATNHKPDVRGRDHGIWRRLRLLPFTVRFWDADKGETGPDHLRADKTLSDRLKAEGPGVLAWAVRGCLDWQRGGMCEPDVVRAATTDYRTEQDTIAAFLTERCRRGEKLKCRANLVYLAYEDWHKKAGEPDKALSLRKFGEAIAEHEIRKEVSNGTWYLGIDLQLPANPARADGGGYEGEP